MRRRIYNLEFPSWCSQLHLAGYQFNRLPEYEERLKSLQHLAGGFSEFQTEPTTGQHAITAVVEHVGPEPRATLEWSGSSTTALWDILLLLSLFTRRDVFAEPLGDDASGAIIRDPQVYAHGGILRISIPYEPQLTDDPPIRYDIGFERGLNRAYDLMCSADWRQRFRGGYFLFLANQAFRRQSLEASFIQCWTIWEHLFSVHNDLWLSTKSIRALRAAEKIAFIFARYNLLVQVDDRSRSRLGFLSTIRHRLVHFGRFPDEENVRQDALLFIRLTEWIVAMTLDLQPSNALNTQEDLEKFLSR